MIKTNKTFIYFTLLLLLLAIYGFNKFASIGENFKLFYLLLPFIYSFYFFKQLYQVNHQILILYLMVFFMNISIINTLIFHDKVLGSVAFSTLRLDMIIFILIPFYTFYLKNEDLFNKVMLFISLEVAISNIIYYFYFYDFGGRFEGTFGGANEFAFMMVFLIYTIYYYFYKFPNSKLKLLFIIILVLLHLLVFITLSRTAILGLFIFYFFSSPYFYSKTKFWQKIIIIVIISVGSIYLYNIFEKTFDLLFDRFTNSEGSDSLDSRAYEIMAGINLLNENVSTIFLGNGTSISDSEVFPQYYDELNRGLETRIHNAYIAIAIENGFVSLAIFVIYIFYMLKKIINIKDKFKFVILGFFLFTLAFLGAIYLFYFLPFWLALFLLSSQIEIFTRK